VKEEEDGTNSKEKQTLTKKKTNLEQAPNPRGAGAEGGEGGEGHYCLSEG
jgi:hypothetical protein